MKAIISGGGTGGHIYPALAIATRLREQGAELLYMGRADSMEEKLSQAAGFAFVSVPTRPLEKGLILLEQLWENWRGIGVARRILREFDPQVVIGTGGYAEYQALCSAQRLGIPTLLHEQNAFPGRANRVLARKATAVCLTFAEAGPYFPHQERLYHTGLPIRSQILSVSPQQARGYFQLATDDKAPTLLITGGSQGAARLNNAAVSAIPALLERGVRIIHCCGQDNFYRIRQLLPDHPLLILRPYLEEMQYALALADLALARAGASFLAEAAAVGLPTLLVPFPYAANDHQRFNARLFENAGAARVVEDSALDGPWLREQAWQLLQSPQRLALMAANARSLAITDAAERIANIAWKLTETGGR